MSDQSRLPPPPHAKLEAFARHNREPKLPVSIAVVDVSPRVATPRWLVRCRNPVRCGPKDAVFSARRRTERAYHTEARSDSELAQIYFPL
jgi:hypothetical protein